MTNEEWSAFLDKVAIEVDKLLLQPGALDVFRLKIRPFKERWDKHCDESRRHAEAKLRHWEAVKKNAKLRDKAAAPPEEGWEWDPRYLLNVGFKVGPEYEIPPEHVEGVTAAVERELARTRTRMEECPKTSAEYRGLADYFLVVEQDLEDLHAEWDHLSPVEKTKTWVKAPRRGLRNGPGKSTSGFMWSRLIDVEEREIFGCWRQPLKGISPHPCKRLIPDEGTRKLPRPRDKTEEYERYYVCLASIHDNQLSGSSSITEEVWPYELAQSVWSKFSWGPAHGPDRAFIETALNRVKAVLENGPEQKGETPTTAAPSEHTMSSPDESDRQRTITVLRDLSTQMNSWATIGWSSYTVSPIGDLLCSLTGYDTALLHLRRHFPSFFEIQELHKRYQAVRDYLEEHKKGLDVKTEPEWSMAFGFRTLVGELGHYGMELAETLRQMATIPNGPGQAGGATAGSAPIEHIQLENGAYKILHTLGSSPTRLHQEELTLCEDPPMDRKTVKRHLTALAEHGLIDYNPRDKKGAAITEKGRAYLNGPAK